MSDWFGPHKAAYDPETLRSRLGYGLQAYVARSDLDHARAVADRLESGRVVINGAPHEPPAPFGGFKPSGVGREYSRFGPQAYLEPRAVRYGRRPPSRQ